MDVNSIEKKNIVVIGAGISGLLSALALSKNGHTVTVLEATDRVGGMCQSYNVGDYKVDTGPHIITRLGDGPLKELMDAYFDSVPIFVHHGEYMIRSESKVRGFPWTLRSFALFDMLPKKDRLYILQTLISLYSQRSIGLLDVDVSVSSIIDKKNLDQSTVHFLDVLCRFMTGMGVDRTPIARFFDSQDYKNYKDSKEPLDYFNGIKNLIMKKGATDQHYPKGGIQSIIECITSSMKGLDVDIRLSTAAVRIIEEDGTVKGVMTEKEILPADIVVYSSYSTELPELMPDLPNDYKNRLEGLEKVLSLTLWLGLDKALFGTDCSEIWIGCDIPCWVVPVTNYDPSLAPNGHQLVGITTNISEDCDIEAYKERLYGVVCARIDGLEKHVMMKHWQVLVPEKAAWTVGQEMPSCYTPVEGLYLVGTDTVRRSMGITRASYSVLNLLDALHENGLVKKARKS
ncbi:MAG: NAD(P)/FAD-dependent oxidoreductase [Candidatus Methanofastidiosa archaeon]|nr:NAD(P)/FAD-dependent oxidoreductase [Candidatus Methanofastidiosa archaeon]